MSTNPFIPNTPESRVWEIAQQDWGLSDDELILKAGWVPHDDNDLRQALLDHYRSSPNVARFTEGLKAHATDWAFNGMRSSYEIADAYGNHMIEMHRAGDLTVHTSHKNTYPRFLADRERKAAMEAGQ